MESHNEHAALKLPQWLKADALPFRELMAYYRCARPSAEFDNSMGHLKRLCLNAGKERE